MVLQVQAVQYLNSNDLRGFTDLINCEDVEAGGQHLVPGLQEGGPVAGALVQGL